MQIHELNNFTGTLGSGAYLAVDDGNDTGKLSTQQLLAATEARIDNIIAGPAPSAEEIVDARLGDDGVTYPSLGDAIRDQVGDLKSEISELTEGVAPLYFHSFASLSGGSETITLTDALEANGFDKIVYLTNTGAGAGFYFLNIYDSDNTATYTSPSSFIVQASETVEVNVGNIEIAKIVITNSNWRNFSIGVKSNYIADINTKFAGVDSDISDLETATADIPLLKNHYKRITLYSVYDNSASTTVTKTISPAISGNGKYRKVIILNNTSSAGFFTLKIYDSSNNVVFNANTSKLIDANSDFSYYVKDIEIAKLEIGNANSRSFTIQIVETETHGRPIIYCDKTGAVGHYSTFYDALAEAVFIGDVDLIVGSGTYDAVSELGSGMSGDMYGTSYGRPIGHNVHLYMASDAKIVCNYTGSNTDIQTKFSPLNAIKSDVVGMSDFEIHGGEIECKNVRYCVHDECDGKGEYTHLYDNCRMTIDNTAISATRQACIGGGFGQYGTIIVDGGEYNCVGMQLESGGSDAVIRYHQPTTENQSEFYNKLICKDVYCVTGTIVGALVGTYDDEVSPIYISGCSMLKAPYIFGSDNPSLAQNMRLIAWNNEVRS